MSELKTLDISAEHWREYYYLETKLTYRIADPVKLVLREGGSGHRIVDADGVTHWCPVNVPHIIRWKSDDEVTF